MVPAQHGSTQSTPQPRGYKHPFSGNTNSHPYSMAKMCDQIHQQQWHPTRALYTAETRNAPVAEGVLVNDNHCPGIDRFCHLCADILGRTVTLEHFAQNALEQTNLETWPHHTDMLELFASGRRGCHLCSMLYVQAASSETGEISKGQLYLRIGSSSPDRYGFEFGIVNERGTTVGTTLAWQQPVPFRDLGHDTSPWRTTSTSSHLTLALANEWLKTCLQCHVACKQRGTFLSGRPERLLRIWGTMQSPMVHLVDLSDEHRNLDYFTLSHCWGSRLPLMLRENNLSRLKKNIPFDDLPKTFQDAVNITLRLGYRALWIDALCIIQDSDVDKGREIPKMGSIYGNSICTIAASSSRNSAEGCYVDRFPLSNIDCHIRTKSGWLLQLSCPGVRILRENLRPDAGMGMLHGPPLFQRGWVVQERALSPRTLYFSEQGIQWECCTTVLSELDTRSAGRDIRIDKLKSNIGEIVRDGGINHSGEPTRCCPSDGTHRTWWHLVRVYTRCLLTETSDRWPAIAGIALALQDAVGSDLIAGMWRRSLYKDLLWEVGGMNTLNRARNRLSNGYPTWSWLSIDSRVFLDEHVLALDRKHFTMKFRHIPKIRRSPSSPIEGVLAEAKFLDIKLVIEAPAARIPEPYPEEDTYQFQCLQEVALWYLSVGDWKLDVWWSSIDPESRCGMEEISKEHELWAIQCTKEKKLTRFLIVHKIPNSTNSWRRVGSTSFEHYGCERWLVPGQDTSEFEIGPRREFTMY